MQMSSQQGWNSCRELTVEPTETQNKFFQAAGVKRESPEGGHSGQRLNPDPDPDGQSKRPRAAGLWDTAPCAAPSTALLLRRHQHPPGLGRQLWEQRLSPAQMVKAPSRLLGRLSLYPPTNTPRLSGSCPLARGAPPQSGQSLCSASRRDFPPLSVTYAHRDILNLI